jgi:hypothetical protein
LRFKISSRQIVHETLSQKNPSQKNGWWRDSRCRKEGRERGSKESRKGGREERRKKNWNRWLSPPTLFFFFFSQYWGLNSELCSRD